MSRFCKEALDKCHQRLAEIAPNSEVLTKLSLGVYKCPDCQQYVASNLSPVWCNCGNEVTDNEAIPCDAKVLSIYPEYEGMDQAFSGRWMMDIAFFPASGARIEGRRFRIMTTLAGACEFSESGKIAKHICSHRNRHLFEIRSGNK